MNTLYINLINENIEFKLKQDKINLYENKIILKDGKLENNIDSIIEEVKKINISYDIEKIEIKTSFEDFEVRNGNKEVLIKEEILLNHKIESIFNSIIKEENSNFIIIDKMIDENNDIYNKDELLLKNIKKFNIEYHSYTNNGFSLLKKNFPNIIIKLSPLSLNNSLKNNLNIIFNNKNIEIILINKENNYIKNISLENKESVLISSILKTFMLDKFQSKKLIEKYMNESLFLTEGSIVNFNNKEIHIDILNKIIYNFYHNLFNEIDNKFFKYEFKTINIVHNYIKKDYLKLFIEKEITLNNKFEIYNNNKLKNIVEYNDNIVEPLFNLVQQKKKSNSFFTKIKNQQKKVNKWASQIF